MAQNPGVHCSKGIRFVVALRCLNRSGWGHAHNAASVVRQAPRPVSGQREGPAAWICVHQNEVVTLLFLDARFSISVHPSLPPFPGDQIWKSTVTKLNEGQ